MELTLHSLKEAHNEMKQVCDSLSRSFENDSRVQQSQDEFTTVIKAVDQFFEIARVISGIDDRKTSKEISRLGECGITLINQLMNYSHTFQLEREVLALGQIALVVSAWIVKNKGQIRTLEPIVDGLESLAKSIHDKTDLKNLVIFMGSVIHACSDRIKQDLEVYNKDRPWRVLNLKRGIVATRTHDTEIMRTVFDELVKTFPLDVSDFFKQGMLEIDRLNYPDNVRQVMQEYRDRYLSPKLH